MGSYRLNFIMSDAPAAAAPAAKALKDRKGSSLAAIKKYIAANYKVDTVKLAPFIKKALKSMVEKKVLVQTKGKGASGSFKLSEAAKAAPKPKKAAKKPAAKKPAATNPAAKKPAAEKKPKAAKKPAKSPAKKAKAAPKKKAAAKK